MLTKNKAMVGLTSKLRKSWEAIPLMDPSSVSKRIAFCSEAAPHFAMNSENKELVVS